MQTTFEFYRNGCRVGLTSLSQYLMYDFPMDGIVRKALKGLIIWLASEPLFANRVILCQGEGVRQGHSGLLQ